MRARSTVKAIVLLAAAGCGPGGGSPDGGGVMMTSSDLGFRPMPNGFMFQNYGPDYMANDILPADLQRMFGDAVCGTGMGATCALSPPMEQWRRQAIKGVAGGHCEGFASLSLLLFAGKEMTSDFGASTAYDLSIMGNDKLQRELAYMWLTQVVAPTGAARIAGPPSAIVKTLGEAFGAGAAKETYTAWFFKKDSTGGHAVTPYGLADRGGGKIGILIYDNNYPGMERAIEVDTMADTWTYSTAANPADMASAYVGDAASKTLGLTPNSQRLGMHTCPACGNASMAGPPMGMTGQLVVNGQGGVLVDDGEGHQVGQMNGGVVNTVPGAEVIGLTSDLDPNNDHQPPLLQLPTGKDLTVTLDGSGMQGDSVSDVEFALPGYTLGVIGADLQPGQTDTLTISKAADEVSYSTGTMETPTLELGIQTDGADWQFLIKATGDAGGQRVDLKIDLVGQKLRVEASNGSGSTSYDIEVHRIDDNGDQVFTHTGNTEASTDAVYLDYGAWGGDGTPMTVELDNGMNGTIDSMISLSDQP